MEFVVEFYEDEDGTIPVEEFLDELKRRQPKLYKLVLAGLSKLKNSDNHGEPLTKYIGDGLLELRVGRKNIARVVWFYVADRKIILLHGFVKKSDRIPKGDRCKALNRKADYERRYLK